MAEKQILTPEDISKIVEGLNPIDWVQMELLAKLPPGQRILPTLNATLMVRAGLRSAFTKKFPELSKSEINMMILKYLTPVRMEKHGSI
ncbi:MAG: hypothetical protein C3F07_11335 [Anaerolineales bacterium]|nr:hypothetical protein [Anaerolineae bacterium]PWB72642.1 MAG: hypothetical protein C3F07_11335 [Anaerolineales bacterium]